MIAFNYHAEKIAPAAAILRRECEPLASSHLAEYPFAAMFAARDYDLRIYYQERQFADLQFFVRR
jgi:hypothetical protein